MGLVDRRDILEEVGTGVSTNIPENTAKSLSTFLAVFTRSDSTEGSTPASISLIDNAVNVSNVAFKSSGVFLCFLRVLGRRSEVSFVDYDLDVQHIAGELTYDPPEDTSVVTHFVLYLARQVNGVFERAPYPFNVSVEPPSTSLAAVQGGANESNVSETTTTGTTTTSSSTTVGIQETQRLVIPCDTVP